MTPFNYIRYSALDELGEKEKNVIVVILRKTLLRDNSIKTAGFGWTFEPGSS
jgi:hypothetical protein